MADLKQYLIDETVEDFAEGRITRRQAMSVLGGLTGALAATQLLAACGKGDPAKPAPGSATASGSAAASGSGSASAPAVPTAPAADSVAADDPAIVAAPTELPGEGATLKGYLARPAADGSYPIVLVCHENRGLTPYVQDVTRRVAKAGYVALAIDLVGRDGGTAAHTPEEIQALLGNSPPERNVKDFLAGLAHARTQKQAKADRVGMVGFCFGGGMTWRVAAALPELRAAVPYYGMPIEAAEIGPIKAAVLAIYAGEDERINKAVPPVEEAMVKAGKTFKKLVYPGVQHAFHNDTRERYDATAAQAAWKETLAWFAQHLA
jgi:carboxymethylenebutenolidase